jgi:hypothetical protein
VNKIRFGPGAEFATPRERIEWMLDYLRAYDRHKLSERAKGTASLLMLDLVEAAIDAQRQAGEAAEISVWLNEHMARALGLAGHGVIKLTLTPCTVPVAEQAKAGAAS